MGDSDSNKSTAPSPQGQAGDASGISRTSGGAGVGGSYAPLMMSQEAKRGNQGEQSSPPCLEGSSDSSSKAAVAAMNDNSAAGNNRGGQDSASEVKGSSSGYYSKLQAEVEGGKQDTEQPRQRSKL